MYFEDTGESEYDHGSMHVVVFFIMARRMHPNFKESDPCPGNVNTTSVTDIAPQPTRVGTQSMTDHFSDVALLSIHGHHY